MKIVYWVENRVFLDEKVAFQYLNDIFTNASEKQYERICKYESGKGTIEEFMDYLENVYMFGDPKRLNETFEIIENIVQMKTLKEIKQWKEIIKKGQIRENEYRYFEILLEEQEEFIKED